MRYFIAHSTACARKTARSTTEALGPRPRTHPMTRSIGLTLYSLVAGREPAAPTDWPARPDGPLVWLHAPPTCPGPLAELARRLREEDDYAVLLTAPNPREAPRARSRAPPAETLPAVRAFSTTGAPTPACWEGDLRATLLTEAPTATCPCSWSMPARPSCTARGCRLAPASSPPARALHQHRRHRRGLGPANSASAAPRRPLRVEGRLARARALPCTEAERAALGASSGPPDLAGAGCPREEAASFRPTAPRCAWPTACCSSSCRNAPSAAMRLPRRGEDRRLACRPRSRGRADAEVEVYIADAPSEMGCGIVLPGHVLGGSLYGGGQPPRPFEAAARSAILHGPQGGAWAPALTRLAEARASRPIAAASDLSDGLIDLLAPDRAAGWRRAPGRGDGGADVTDGP